jgi:hypothetical protein
MHLYDTVKGEEASRLCENILKMNNANHDIDAINRVEVFGTDLDDKGQDYCEYRVYDCRNELVAVRRELGY